MKAKSKKKVTTKKKQSKKLLWFLLLIPILLLTVIALQQPQIYQQKAASVGIATCGGQGEPGNEKGVGKFCTEGGGECNNQPANQCSADHKAFVGEGPALCSMQCDPNVQDVCGTGATCAEQKVGFITVYGCKPIVCDQPVVPSAQCLGNTSCGEKDEPTNDDATQDDGGQIDEAASDSAQENQPDDKNPDGNADDGADQGENGGGQGEGGGLFSLIIGFIIKIIELIIGLFK